MTVLRSIAMIFAMKCDQASLLASDSLDRDLTFSERWGSRFHNLMCRSCRLFRYQIEIVRTALAKLSHTGEGKEGAEPIKLSDRTKAAIRSRLN